MYSYNQPPDQPVGIDYLNQIAAPPPRPGFDRKTKIILAIFGTIGVLSLIFIFSMAQQSRGPSPRTMIARLQKLQTVSETYRSKLKSTRLQEANSSLIAVLTTANNSKNTLASAHHIDLKKEEKQIKTLDSPDKLQQKFDNAYLNADLDRTYAYTISTELADTIFQLERLQKSATGGTSQFLKKTISDLANVRRQFTAITETS